MQAKRKQRLWLMIVMIIGAMSALALILYALNQNINLYFTPSQLLAQQTLLKHRLRIGGLVQKGSVHYDDHGLTVHFSVTDNAHAILVHYTGVLPDLFKEGRGIIVQGRMNATGEFAAEQVLAKHGADYKPPASQKNNKNLKE